MNNNHSDLITRYTQVVAGIQKNLASTTNLVFAGVTYSGADLEKLFQSWLAAAAAVTAANAQWRAAITAERALLETTQTVWVELRSYARSQYAATPTVLADFGFTAAKKVAKDPTTLVAAAQKSRATRVARHTMGKNQKKSIHGVVPDPVAAPAPTAPAVAVTKA